MVSAREQQQPYPGAQAREEPGIQAWNACSGLESSNSASKHTARRTTPAAVSRATPARCGLRTRRSKRQCPRGGEKRGQSNPDWTAP
ncbi:UNVERIFIED_CONTAM: hypothetical protein Slati_0530300 [Sesamum latifolium]|uniref:Uncharacterized protein n=1 Tax=Sesamum latifolium TaxID=2727402 RepID=A0AAW2Y0D4_9LAMI